MPILLRSITFAALAFASGVVAAHDGGASAGGCHHDAKGYHCHRGDASRSSPVKHVAADRSGNSPDASSSGLSHRDCATAIPACGSIEETANGTGPSRATGKTGEEQRGMKAMLEAGGTGLLAGLAVLFVLGLSIIREAQGRHSPHRN